VTFFATETDLLIDNVAAVIVSGTLLLLVILLYIRIYNNRQKQFEALGRLKTEFLQDISHEMQNPLTTITAGIDYANSCISKPNGAIDARDTLKIVQDEAMRLGRMVSGMVKLVAMSGNAESREKVNFAVMLNNCAEMFRLILVKKGNTLHVDVAPELPYVYCVADRITQVLINLLSNAAKYTKNGQVSLLASHDTAFITIRVRNSGDGIPPELLSHVFDRGVSGNEGSGLGLTICKTIVEAHGGVIKIESEPNKGAEAIFTIPVYGGQSEVRGYE
jgi:signal transduction histidine kinase